MQVADALPHRVSHLINLDGLPSRRNWPDVSEHDRTKLLAGGSPDGWTIVAALPKRSAAPERSTNSPNAAAG